MIDVESLKENRRGIAIAVALVAVVILLLWLGSSLAIPGTIEARFKDGNSKVQAGEDKVLVVRITNTQGDDLTNVVTRVAPESDAAFVKGDARRVEAKIGAGAHRDLEFTIGTLSNATKGTYKITVTSEMGERTEEASVYLDVTS